MKQFLLKSTIRKEPEGSGTKDFAVVMYMLNGKYVTHLYTPDNDACFSGNYFMEANESVKDFIERCEKWGVTTDFFNGHGFEK